MATGTWNQGELEKRVTKIDLENYPTIQFRDDSLTSDQIFDIIDFPNRFTAGKNLIKLRASNEILVKNAKIHIEILDSNGDPVYYEPLNYVEHDGTRVISIWIYPNKTAPGIGTVYIASRTKVDLTSGQPIEFSQNFSSPNYINNPNVLWSRNISIAPENSKNNTEIIFTKPYPKAIVREQVNKFFSPINLTSAATTRNGAGSVTIKPIPSTAPINTSTVIPNYEGGATARTPVRTAGRQVAINPTITQVNNDIPLEVTNAEIVTVSTFSRLETIGFALSASMEGGTITITNPNVENIQPATAALPDGTILPKSQYNFSELGSAVYNSAQLSGSYTFVIDKVLSSTKANVFQTSGFKNDADNTVGAFSFQANRFASIVGLVPYDIKDISATSNFTCSYIQPFILSETEQSQSFAEITLANIEPATGDVYKVQTLYKPSGQFGDFIDAGTVNVEQVELFEDVTSFESIQSLGTVYNRIGFFTDLSDFSKYWETTNGVITTEVALTPSYKPEVLLDGIELAPNSAFDSTSNRFGYLHLKSEYHPKLFADTRYVISLNATVESTVSTDPDIQYSRLDIYVSGSNTSIESDSEYINQYKISNLDINDTLTGNLVNNGKLGTRVGTIELAPGQNFEEDPAVISFKAKKDENVDIYFVIRRGKWTVSNLSLKSDKQTGFSPNFTRINTRIPTEFLNTPLTFKFLYFDIHNNQAQAETTVFPVTFVGDNLIIGGDDNLLSGSVYIGNSIGSGIELAGVNSGFIRSIGYEGFESASRPDKPGGFMLYTGSVLPNAPDNYSGVGIEIVQDSSSFLKFDTTDGLDIRAKKFFVGTNDTQFVSGSDGNIEISSSNFHLNRTGDVTMAGTITATAGQIAGFTIDGNKLTANNFELDAAGKSIKLGTGNTIFTADADTGIQLGNATFDNAPFSVTTDGTLKATDGTIGGWTLADDRITGGKMIIRSDGTIESDGFVSNLDGSGFRLTAASGGFLEVENARIRGTLATAVFEKETVNAVGGQLYVANSTTLTASIDNPAGSYSATDTTMSVVNVTGFAYGEILSAKKVNSTGFQTEYFKIDSASRNNSNSETDFSGKIYVTRSYGSGINGDSGSLGNTPGGAQSYTGSQVLVSTGKLGTGYIRLNANPNDQATPYIQIVERTGSGVYDLDLKAQLGDLSGVTDNINGIDVSGFGLYTDNAFLKGGIVATYGAIGGFGISSTTISSSNNNLILRDSGQITGSTVLFNGGEIGGFTIDGHSLSTTGVEINDNTQTLFISSSDFKVSHTGEMTASHANFEGVASAESFEYKALFLDADNTSSYLSTYTKSQTINVPDVGNTAVTRTFYKLDLSGGTAESANYVIIDPGMELLYPIGRIDPKNDGEGHGQFVFIETGYINSSGTTGRRRKYFTRDGTNWYDSSPSSTERISIKSNSGGVFGAIWRGYDQHEVLAVGNIVPNSGERGFDSTTGWAGVNSTTISTAAYQGVTALKALYPTGGTGYVRDYLPTETGEVYAYHIYYSYPYTSGNPNTDLHQPYVSVITGDGTFKTTAPARSTGATYKTVTGKFKATSTSTQIRLGNEAPGSAGSDKVIYWSVIIVGKAYEDTYEPREHKTMLFRRSAFTGWSIQSMDNTGDVNTNFENIHQSLEIENIGGSAFIDLKNDRYWADNASRLIRDYSATGDGGLTLQNRGTGSIQILAGAFPTPDNGRDSTIRLSAGYQNDVILDKEALFPDINLDLDLGKPGKRWKTLYVQNQSIYFGSGSVNTAILSFNTGSNELEFRNSETTGAFNPIRVAAANFGDSASFEGVGSVQIGQNVQGFIAVNALPGKHSTIFRAESSVLSGDQRMGSITQKSSGSFAILLDADSSQANRAKFVVESNSAVPGFGPRLFSVSESGETKAHGYLTVSQSVTADSFVGSLSNMTGTVDGGSF